MRQAANTTRAKGIETAFIASGVPGSATAIDTEPYRPQSGEKYMSPRQLKHFRERLLRWKQTLVEAASRTVDDMREAVRSCPDFTDRASQESDLSLVIRARDRDRKLLRKIDQALTRIDDGSYGFCDETGEEIGLSRLEARPIATLCIEAQERRERNRKQFSEDDA